MNKLIIAIVFSQEMKAEFAEDGSLIKEKEND
jgi:hypothetical protein